MCRFILRFRKTDLFLILFSLPPPKPRHSIFLMMMMISCFKLGYDKSNVNSSVSGIVSGIVSG